MSENNVEEKEILEEQIIDEEAVEATADEALENEETNKEIGETKVSFMKSFSAIIVDEIIVGIISIVLFYILEGLLRLGGYFISQKINMVFLLFVVASILYVSIMETAKAGKTVGKKLFNI